MNVLVTTYNHGFELSEGLKKQARTINNPKGLDQFI